MKKLILVLAMVLSPVLGFAASTATPTFTATLTHTPTPTFTPTPVAAFDPAFYREYVYPHAVYANNGVVLASAVTTPLPGSANPWVAQVVSQTAFVMSTGSAKVRWGYGIPGNLKVLPKLNPLNVWAYVSTTATATAFTVTLNVARNPMNNLAPSGTTVYLGTATSIATALTGSSTSGKILRVKLPISSSARFQPGDQLNFDLQRSGNTTADLYIYRLEMEYAANPYYQH